MLLLTRSLALAGALLAAVAAAQTIDDDLLAAQMNYQRATRLAEKARQEADLALLTSPYELAVAAKLGEFPEIIESAARELAPHMVAFYLKDLAAEFHSYYNAERMLVDDAALKEARIALAGAVRQVIRNGLAILGVSCPQSM